MGRKAKNTQLTQQIIEYLELHCPISKSQLCQDLNITTRQKETISEQLKKIKQQGYIIYSPVRSEIIQGIEKPSEIYEPLDNNSITKTLILMILSTSKRPLSQSEIEELLIDFTNGESQSVNIYKYLNLLKKEHLITYHDNRFKISSRYPHFISNSSNEYIPFFNSYDDLLKTTPSPDILQNLHHKISLLIENDNVSNISSYILSSQRGSSFTNQTIDNLKLLSYYSYDKYQLEIEYKNYKNEITQFIFSTGMIIISFEKNNIYLFGEIDHKQIILKISNIISIKETNKINHIYESNLYKDIYDEMFSISLDDPTEVEILFKDLPNHNIRHKINNLISIRNKNLQGIKLARIVETNDDNYFIYKDKIRGISDLAKYLRSFGSNVTIINPPELKDLMIQSATKIKSNYESRGLKYENN